MSELSVADLRFLRRCVELAREALEAGDEPFGSVLVGPAGEVLFEDRNRVKDGDGTRHPEFEIARWAGRHLPISERGRCVVYTSGEHCPMCAAAHGWARLGRIVYAASSEQLAAWSAGWSPLASPVVTLPITAVVPGVPVSGPAPELAEELRELHRRNAERQAHLIGAGSTQPADVGPRGGAGGVRQLRLVVHAEDYHRALAFFRDTLEMPVSEAYSGEGGAEVSILEAGRATLELSNPAQIEMIDAVEVGRRVAPHYRVALEVGDCASMTQRAVDGGAALVAEPTRTPWHSLNARLDAPAGIHLTLFEELGE